MAERQQTGHRNDSPGDKDDSGTYIDFCWSLPLFHQRPLRPMHLLIPVHCATSCAFSVLSLALVGLFLVFVWAYKFQHSGKLSLGGVLTWESLPDGARSLSRGFSLKRQPCDSKIPIEMVESQRRFSYDSQPPVSMAKMIMSRHTFRRPAPKIALPPPPPRAVIPPPPRRTRSLSPPRQQRAQSSPRQPPSTMV